MRRLFSALASVGLAATAAGLAVTPAQAEPNEFELLGPAEVSVWPQTPGGTPKPSESDIMLHWDTGGDEGMESGQATITYDFSALAGVATAEVQNAPAFPCTVTGAKVVCERDVVWGGYEKVARLKLTAADGAAVGATADVKVTGQLVTAHATETFAPLTTKVTVGGPDLALKELPLKSGLKPGASQALPVTFANVGTTKVDGALLTMFRTPGLEIPERYSNCEYGKAPEAVWQGFEKVLCTLDGPYEPGAEYTLEQPLSLKAAADGLYERFTYRIGIDDPAERAEQRGAGTFTKGTGPALTVKKKSVAPLAAELDLRNNQYSADLDVDSTADFVARGASVEKAAAGEKLTLAVGFRNEGPARVDRRRGVEGIAKVDVEMPRGVKVTAVPAQCVATEANRRYVCDVPPVVENGAERTLPFEVKVTKVIEDATGKITVRHADGAGKKPAFDPDPADNTAAIVLNGTAPAATTGGGVVTGGVPGGD
ncbi:peptidase, partial [Streptomyces sp. NPDC048629]